MNFITKTTFTADLTKMINDCDSLINKVGWPDRQVIDGKIFPANQLGLKYRKGSTHPLTDAGGNLYDEKTETFISTESDFTEWVDECPSYMKQVILDLEKHENVKFGRIRLMRLMPKTGLTVHKDFEDRYHFVLSTNENAFFGEKLTGEVTAQCFHIPADSHFYKVDTTRDHFVYNGGWEPRIHLVINTIR